MLVFLNLLLTFLDHVRDDETVPSLTPTLSGSVPAPVPSGASAVAAAAAAAASPSSSSSSQSIESQHTQSKALRCLKLLCESAVLAPFLLQLMTAK